MKQILLTALLMVVMLSGGCDRHSGSARGFPGPPLNPPTFSSFDAPGGTNAVSAGQLRFVEANPGQVFARYQELSGRSIIRSPSISTNIRITFENTRAMTCPEALQALDNVLAAHQITMIHLGTRYVKAVPSAGASQEPGPVIEVPWQELPDSSSYLTYITRLKYLRAEEATSIAQPFAKLPNSIIGVKGSGVLVLRDYSSNVRRMMEILERMDQSDTNFWPRLLPRGK